MEKKNVATKEKKERRIFAGYYKRYDGFSFYIVDVVPDLETGQEFVICKRLLYNKDNKNYFVLSREEFCSKIEFKGKIVNKFYRDLYKKEISETTINFLKQDGYRTPIHHEKRDPQPKPHHNCPTYLEYAKELCRCFQRDLRYYKLCMDRPCFKPIREDVGFKALKADMIFIRSCLKTTLSDYQQYFEERFLKKKSMRKYAEEHNLGRGSVEYIQKKFITALAQLLQERDQADGIPRIADGRDNDIFDDDCF